MANNKIKIIREEKGMTLSELSNLSKISVGYLCHLEIGTRKNPSFEVMEKIAKALNRTIKEVFFIE